MYFPLLRKYVLGPPTHASCLPLKLYINPLNKEEFKQLSFKSI